MPDSSTPQAVLESVKAIMSERAQRPTPVETESNIFTKLSLFIIIALATAVYFRCEVTTIAFICTLRFISVDQVSPVTATISLPLLASTVLRWRYITCLLIGLLCYTCYGIGYWTHANMWVAKVTRKDGRLARKHWRENAEMEMRFFQLMMEDQARKAVGLPGLYEMAAYLKSFFQGRPIRKADTSHTAARAPKRDVQEVGKCNTKKGVKRDAKGQVKSGET